jgi:sialate O-acetylesterase
MIGKPAKLTLGRIVDSDSVYVNGSFVGTTSYQYPPRRYEIPPGTLKPGKNLIVVRVINVFGSGGFVKDKMYQISDSDQIVDLRGDWKYRLGTTANSLEGPTFFNYKPLGLFNGMIAPILNHKIKGVIWYQGESNTERAIEYRKLFPALIKNWRAKWNEENFPFLYVQLANFMESKNQPVESNWAELRESQRRALALPKTGMAVSVDLGEWNDIHPENKEDVGKRLALAARVVAYGDKEVVSSGPLYKSMKIRNGKIIISFTNIGSGLMIKGGGELKHFAIASKDKKFVWAKALIDGNSVVVWNTEIKHPVVVRYAWGDNPEGANLFNNEGLPASPFQTGE